LKVCRLKLFDSRSRVTCGLISITPLTGTPMSTTPLAVKDDPDAEPRYSKSPIETLPAVKSLTPIRKTLKKEKSPSTPTPTSKTPVNGHTGPQLIPDLPHAEEEAYLSFITLDSNNYQYKTLGLVKSIEESYQCDCVYELGGSILPNACARQTAASLKLKDSRTVMDCYSNCDIHIFTGISDPTDACGEGSECINRLTQVECEPEECRCRSYCQNQR
jgi:hypothetical protein